MDSLTQLVLGAAVGEVVLGKKAGNRAMVWGAIGGTIPDMDVFSHLVSDEIASLAFHRAITHSLFFAVVTPFLLGWLVNALDTKPPKEWFRTAGIVWAALFLIIGLGSLPMPFPAQDAFAIAFSVSTIIMIFPVGVFVNRHLRKRSYSANPLGWQAWAWLFFWSIITHPLLDTCTSYGTQLFQPFHNYRAAIDNISVVDPMYTVPFLICLLLASRRKVNNVWRSRLNYLGIALSSAYKLFTFYNAYRVDQIFKESLERKNIAYNRVHVSPTIFNNILWQGLAESDTAYYYGMYSLLDREPRVQSFSIIPKSHQLLDAYPDDRTAGILKWFSNGYYTVLPRADGALQFIDLRFGAMDEKVKADRDFVFRFILKPENGQLKAYQNTDRPPDMGGALQILLDRIRGI